MHPFLNQLDEIRSFGDMNPNALHFTTLPRMPPVTPREGSISATYSLRNGFKILAAKKPSKKTRTVRVPRGPQRLRRPQEVGCFHSGSDDPGNYDLVGETYELLFVQCSISYWIASLRKEYANKIRGTQILEAAPSAGNTWYSVRPTQRPP